MNYHSPWTSLWGLIKMSPQALLDSLPHVLTHGRRMLAFVHLAFMADLADIDRIRQNPVDMAPAERTTARRAARAVDPDRKPKALSIKTLLKTHHAPSLEITLEERAHDPRMVLDNMQRAILDPVA
jgi:hypothetical protein